ncbi:unnamed protein product [Cyprideis torosa]|uniref:Uncharacterized protein n=1 Tax=Cyprideis torosa TaxID=163714 RepID=A0A7R8W9B3_9CRUS|nr:unnamed protein product [Cyprideis torosa]CAG0889574.1 unnamed protein product [Cyprideis torosa]
MEEEATRLLRTFNATVDDLQAQILNYESRQESLELRLEEVVAENERLSKNLQDVLSERLRGLEMQTLHKGGEPRVLAQMKRERDFAIEERDRAMELWKGALAELERMPATSVPSQMGLEASAEVVLRLKSELAQAVHQVEIERRAREDANVRHQQELHSEKQRLEAAIAMFSSSSDAGPALTAALAKLKDELKRCQHQKDEATARLETMGSELSSIKRQMNLTSERLTEAEEQTKHLTDENRHLSLRLEESQHETHRLKAEVSRLEASMALVVEEAGKQAELGVQEIRQSYENALHKLKADMNASEKLAESAQLEAESARKERDTWERNCNSLQKKFLLHNSEKDRRLNSLKEKVTELLATHEAMVLEADEVKDRLRSEWRRSEEGRRSGVERATSLEREVTRLQREIEEQKRQERERHGALEERARKLRNKEETLEKEKQNVAKRLVERDREVQKLRDEFEARMRGAKNHQHNMELQMTEALTREQNKNSTLSSAKTRLEFLCEKLSSELEEETARRSKETEELRRELKAKRVTVFALEEELNIALQRLSNIGKSYTIDSAAMRRKWRSIGP